VPLITSLMDRLRGAIGVLYREMIKFGVVGAVAFVIDLGSFNLLRATVLRGEGTGILSNAVVATILSALIATCVAWIGNRMWTFRHRRNRPVHHEALLFALTNGVALLIQAACVGLTNQLIAGEPPRLTENIAKVVGIGLGTLFRFWAYRRFVFSREPLVDTSPLAERHRTP
jgi:putative flippase GtrA